MKWDTKLLLVSLFVYLLLIVIYFLDSGDFIPPLFLNAFYLPVFSLVLLIATPLSIESVIMFFFVIGFLNWPIDIFKLPFASYFGYGNIIALGGTSLLLIPRSIRRIRKLIVTSILRFSIAFSIIFQLLILYVFDDFAKVLLWLDLVIVISSILLLFPIINGNVKVSEKRIYLILILSVSYNFLAGALGT